MTFAILIAMSLGNQGYAKLSGPPWLKLLLKMSRQAISFLRNEDLDRMNDSQL